MADSDALDSDYRVTLWIPTPSAGKTKCWECLGVSHGDGARSWPAVTSECLDKMNVSGLVAVTAYENVGLSVEGLSAEFQKDQELMAEYRRKAFLDEATQKTCSWQWASAVTWVAKRSGGPIQCIVMIERESGGPIEFDQGLMGDPIRAELDLAALMWTEASGGMS